MMMFRNALKKRWVKITLEILFFILLYLALRAWMQRDMAAGIAPDFQSVTLTQQSYVLSSSPKPVLVHFWATWCPVCKLEQDSIQALSRDYHVITIAMSSGDDEEVRTYLQKHQLDFAVINDPAGEISARYGVVGVPASFIVNEEGNISSVERGYTTGWGLRLRLWLAKL